MLDAISFLNKYIFGLGVPLLLMLISLFYCVRLKFFHLLHPIKIVKSLFCGRRSGGVSSAKAVTLALAGTLGVGNMVGVASAIALGGFGAIFWMWVSAFLAMILKYAEIVLAMRHRRFDENGKPHGSAMYYIKDCFGKNKLGIVISTVFAILCVLNSLSMGSMIQINAAASAMNGVFNIPPVLVGTVFSVIAFFSLRKGNSGVLSITEKLVPLMTVGFVILSLAVICIRPRDAAEAFSLIFKNAFDFRSGVGGVVGFLASGSVRSVRYGTMRGMLSNEAGCGTAPAAHAVADCEIPAKQGIWGIFEVFVDTVLLCTLTAIVIIIGSDAHITENDYMMITVESYSSVLGSFAGYFIAVSVLLFGLATVLCWGYYGMESARYLFPYKRVAKAFVFIYSASVVLGSVISSNIIWEIADLALGSMTFINLTILLIMNREVKESTDSYFFKC